MNIKDYLVTQDVDYTLYKLTQVNIKDILIFDKRITQTVTQKKVQCIQSEWEPYREKMEDIPSSHKFLKNDFEVWKYKKYSIEPGSWIFDDCYTCDWHWVIACSQCDWKWEVHCPKCHWKTLIEQVEFISNKQIIKCQSCWGSWEISYPCKRCNSTWQIQVFKPCTYCHWRGMIQNNFTGWIPQVCNACNWSRQIQQNDTCMVCSWTWHIKQKCMKCWGRWEYETSVQEKQIKHITCDYCKWTWRVICSLCRWERELTCSWCRWERRTYQFLHNTFEIVVESSPKLFETKLDQRWYDLLWTITYPNVTSISEKQKEELSEYSTKNSLKITPTTIKSVEGVLYILESLKSGMKYYVWYYNWEYYNNEKIPKDNFWEMVSNFTKNISEKWKKVWRTAKNLWKGSKEY